MFATMFINAISEDLAKRFSVQDGSSEENTDDLPVIISSKSTTKSLSFKDKLRNFTESTGKHY